MNILAPYQLVLAEDYYQQQRLKDYIQDEYSREFNAAIPHFLPHLLGLYRADGTLIGACGINPAGLPALYLEHYLDEPVEQAIARQTAAVVARSELVEIGNFACSAPGHARVMFAALCLMLYENTFTHVVFTGTQKLRNVFRHLRLSPLELAPALPERLGEEASAWGEYYRSRPQVMAGELSPGFNTLANGSLLLPLVGPSPHIYPIRARAGL